MTGSPAARVARALLLSSVIAGAGYRRHALSVSGAAGALLVGFATMMAGGWRWSATLLSFFVSSSALSRLEGKSAGGRAIARMTERGSERDVVQVLANGGVATLAALGQIRSSHHAFALAQSGAFAAANGDTWATEIGGLSPSPPRHILTGQPVPPGTSGGVTPAGLGGSLAGSLLIGVVAGTVMSNRPRLGSVIGVTLAGMAGSLLDSVAGATLQATYRCPACEEQTERRMHACGTRTELVRGYAWCTNDLVNGFCTLAGALCAAAFATVMPEEAGRQPTEGVD